MQPSGCVSSRRGPSSSQPHADNLATPASSLPSSCGRRSHRHRCTSPGHQAGAASCRWMPQPGWPGSVPRQPRARGRHRRRRGTRVLRVGRGPRQRRCPRRRRPDVQHPRAPVVRRRGGRRAGWMWKNRMSRSGCWSCPGSTSVRRAPRAGCKGRSCHLRYRLRDCTLAGSASGRG